MKIELSLGRELDPEGWGPLRNHLFSMFFQVSMLDTLFNATKCPTATRTAVGRCPAARGAATELPGMRPTRSMRALDR